MSSHTFVDLTRSDPELGHLGSLIDAWRSTQSTGFQEEFSFSDLIRDLSDQASAMEFAHLVRLVESSPQFQIYLRVQDPEGNIVGGEFESLVDVPDAMSDRSGREFHVTLESIIQMVRVK